MRITAPSPRIINELTKYVSVGETKAINRQLYSCQKFKEGNEACDKFFRTSELFDENNDVFTIGYRQYSSDDVELCDRTSLRAIDTHKLHESNSKDIDTDLPYYIDIIGTNKRVYLENIGNKNPKYPYKADSNIYKNIKIDDLVNIQYYSKVDFGDISDLKQKSIELLQEKMPLKTVIDYIKKSILHAPNGVKIGAPGFMEFISKHPDLRRYMITYKNSGTEVFDSTGAKVFDDICEMVHGDEKLAYARLWDCRLQREDGAYETCEDLFKLLKIIYKKRGDISSESVTELFDIFKNKESNLKKFGKILRALNKGLSIEETAKLFQPKKQ